MKFTIESNWYGINQKINKIQIKGDWWHVTWALFCSGLCQLVWQWPCTESLSLSIRKLLWGGQKEHSSEMPLGNCQARVNPHCPRINESRDQEPLFFPFISVFFSFLFPSCPNDSIKPSDTQEEWTKDEPTVIIGRPGM